MKSTCPYFLAGEHFMLKGIKGISFDLDGTLFDSCSVSKMAIKEGFDAFWEEIGEKGPVPSWEEIVEHIGLPSYGFFPALLPEKYKHLWRDLHGHVGRCERDRLSQGRGITFEGVHETLKQLKDKGFILGCLSNASRVYFDAVLDGCRLRDYFAKLACIGERPDLTKADILKEWADEAGGKDKLIYVGDRCGDIEAAHKTGLKAVGVSFGYGNKDELSGADVIIEKMEELINLVEKE
jgi:phosphoglycolate phosphatase